VSTRTQNYLEAVEYLPDDAALIVNSVTRKEYEQLLDDMNNWPGMRVTYCKGRIRFRTLSSLAFGTEIRKVIRGLRGFHRFKSAESVQSAAMICLKASLREFRCRAGRASSRAQKVREDAVPDFRRSSRARLMRPQKRLRWECRDARQQGPSSSPRRRR
jgi:hypothetical protein